MISLKRFLYRVIDSEVFNGVIVYTFMRDTCVIIDHVYNDLVGKSDERPFVIKEIRNKIKLFEKGKGKNKRAYEKVLQQHLEDFKEYTDNVGFYVNNYGQVIGSTIYVEYLLRRLQNLKEYRDDNKPEIYYVSQEVGSQMQGIITGLEEAIPMLRKYSSVESSFKGLEEFDIVYKDINHAKLFNGNDFENVFKYLLLLISQECFAVRFISENYDSRIIDRDFIDDYFLKRFITIRIDSIVDSLINLKEFFPPQFEELVNNGQGELSTALESYMISSFEKVAELRNTIHYGNEKNFYDYFIEETEIINLTEVLNINRTVFKCIDDFLSISNIPSQY